MRDRGNPVFTEQLGEKPHHHFAVFEHVAHPAGHPQVVFQHEVLAVSAGIRRTNNVDATDVRVNVAGHVDAHHFRAELRVLKNLLRRNHAGFEDFLSVVDVMNKTIERRDALYEAFFHGCPLMRRNDAGDQVKGNQSLGASTVFVLGTINGESDADPPKNHLGLFPPCLHGLRRLARQPVSVALVMFAHAVGGRVHFVKHRSAHGQYLRLHARQIVVYQLSKLYATEVF